MAGEDVALPPEKNTGLQGFCRFQTQHLSAQPGDSPETMTGDVRMGLVGSVGCDRYRSRSRVEMGVMK